MPTPTPADVAAHLGLPSDTDLSDARLVSATEAGVAWATRKRTVGQFDDPDIHKGTVMYAALIYQARAMPSGFPGPEALLGGGPTSAEGYWRAVELVGVDEPAAVTA